MALEEHEYYIAFRCAELLYPSNKIINFHLAFSNTYDKYIRYDVNKGN